jgi:hypothetical protein
MSIESKCLMICVAKSIIQTYAKFGFLYSSMAEDSDFLESHAGSFEEWSRRLEGMCSYHFEVSKGPRLITLLHT